MPVSDAAIFGRGIAFPPRLGPDGRVMYSAGPKNIRESIQVILLTNRGERLMRAAFGGGLRTFLFRPNTTATHRLIEERAHQALGRWEPRIRVEDVTVRADPADPEAALLTVTYRLIATGQTNQMALTLQFTS